MDLAARRLFAYYESADCADDLRRLAGRDPAQAKAQRRDIARHLNENFAALGEMPSELDSAAQARFIEGDLSSDEFLAQMRLYAQSITARWSGES